MKKIGFKCAWMKDEKPKRNRPVEQEEEMPMIVPGTPMGHMVEVLTRIEQHESIIASAAFTRMNKQEKQDMLASYRFLLTTLAMIQTPTSGGGMSEFGSIDVDIEM
jgi:hypothetical protein